MEQINFNLQEKLDAIKKKSEADLEALRAKAKTDAEGIKKKQEPAAKPKTVKENKFFNIELDNKLAEMKKEQEET